jgi:hypothetical protein
MLDRQHPIDLLVVQVFLVPQVQDELGSVSLIIGDVGESVLLDSLYPALFAEVLERLLVGRQVGCGPRNLLIARHSLSPSAAYWRLPIHDYQRREEGNRFGLPPTRRSSRQATPMRRGASDRESRRAAMQSCY